MTFNCYHIKKGNHFSGIHIHPRFGKMKSLRKHVVFMDAAYNLNCPDQFDWNKLFGFSYGHHHRNSVRFGWRYNLQSTLVEISAYYYVNGKRHYDTICSVNQNEEYIFEIYSEWNDSYTLTVFSPRERKWIGATTIYSVKETFWGYLLHPYFGGNQVAPRDIKILMA